MAITIHWHGIWQKGTPWVRRHPQSPLLSVLRLFFDSVRVVPVCAVFFCGLSTVLRPPSVQSKRAGGRSGMGEPAADSAEPDSRLQFHR